MFVKDIKGRVLSNMKSIEVRIHSSEEIKKLSAVKIITPLVLNALGHPVPGGLYDLSMGPMLEDSGPCATCRLPVFACPGHLGHIELPLPVVNPLFYGPLGTFLRNTCFECNRLQVSPQSKFLTIGQLRLLDKGYVTSAKNAENVFSNIESMDSYSVQCESRLKALMDDYVQEELKNMGGLDEADVWLVESMKNEIISKAFREYSNRKVCFYCGSYLAKVATHKTRIMATIRKEEVCKEGDENNETNDNSGAKLSKGENAKVKRRKSTVASTHAISPDASRTQMRKVWDEEKDYVELIFPVLRNTGLRYPVDLLYLEVIPVTPPCARPPNVMKSEIIEHVQTTTYKKIVQDVLVLKNVMVAMQDESTDSLTPEGKLMYNAVMGKTAVEKLHYSWENLQNSVDTLMDNSLHPGISQGEGLKQLIEKKQGIIRMHVMGKRVDFASRSVITPDPNLNVDEVGLPEAFAKKLTFPVPVTPWNVNELRAMVINGPLVHPGANMIQNSDGSVTKISDKDALQRKALAKMLLTPDEKLSKVSKGVKIVHRHLVNGDILLMNRQPTLHKPSIMAHKARILKGEKTLRMHYANCKSYNADFDGDEMNAHCPQSELGRSEAYNLVDVCNQYLVPKDGTPLSGLIQDHMVSGVRLSLRGKFFTKDDYMQLVYQSIAHIKGDIILLPPTIVKPKTLWSGKQIISTLLINIIPRDRPRINLSASAKIGAHAWIREEPRPWRGGGSPLQSNAMSEADVVIRQGELLSGVLDKTHYGATPYGLVHCVYELYGGKCANSLLTALGKLFMAFLQFVEGFTLGVEDILVLEDADRERAEIIKECRTIGKKAAAAALGVPSDTEDLTPLLYEAYSNRPNFRGEIDMQYKSVLNTYTDKINQTCLPAGLLRKFPDNNLQLMVMSGAKGSTVNTMQISCLLGQIELEGRRPPLMISGRSLPSFAPFDCQPRAGGFIDGRFLTGIQPQEFFFHCMAGREGLIDTAVKTSRSGYLQRCLVKHLEGLSVHYDTTVRDSDGSVIQFAYGEDGMDVTKMPFLKPKQMHFIYENRHVIANWENIATLKASTDLDVIKEKKKRVSKWTDNFGGTNKQRVSAFLKFSEQVSRKLDEDHPERKWKYNKVTGRSDKSKYLIKAWKKVMAQEGDLLRLQTRCPDPVCGEYPPSVHLGALPERLEVMLEEYLTNGEGRHLRKKEKKAFREIVYYKVLSSTCHAGEPVGVLAAQSVGEPSTQMTLNTFHFAGRGEMNVTLGIPRLKEVLMTASKNISTPSMEIPFHPGVPAKKAEKLKAKLRKLKLSDVLEFIKVTESLTFEPERFNVYTLEIHFLPHDLYKKEFSTSPQKILQHVERVFLAEFLVEFRRLTKIKVHIAADEGHGDQEQDDDAEAVDEPMMKKKKASGEQHVSSDEEEGGDEEDASAANLRKKRLDGDHADESDSSEDSGDEKEAEVDRTEKESEGNEDGTGEAHESKGVSSGMVSKRRAYVMDRYNCVKSYEFDEVSQEWCKVQLLFPIGFRKINLSSILTSVASNSVIDCVPGINRAFVVNDKSQGLLLKTDGLNMAAMVKYADLLDINRMYSNDIHAVYSTYGVEAAGRVIVKEIQEVFKVYGIEVDPRHLTLISDYLTSDGSYRGMNRRGLENNPSFLQKMSFESSLQFLKSAVWRGKKELFQSPSSRIFVGHPCKSGTGSFEVLQKLTALES